MPEAEQKGPVPSGVEGPKRALVVAAHPDDADFGVAGTVCLWSREGWEFYYLICTDGSKGSDDPDMTPGTLVPQRREEQREAARVAGARDVFFLDYVDGEVEYSRDILRDITRHIRRLRPFAVFTHDPNQIVRDTFINHRDHRLVGEMAIDAVYPVARNRPSFPDLLGEGLEPFSVSELYLSTSSQSNFEVDISEVVDVKLDALSRHRSQIEDIQELGVRLREFWAEPDGRILERFRRIELPF